MKKIVSAVLLVVLLFCLTSCSMAQLKNKILGTKSIVIPMSDESSTQPQFVVVDDTTAPSDSVSIVVPDNGITPDETTAPATTTVPNKDSGKQTSSEVKTYYTDDPNNKYIASIADYFKIDRGCLVAFVRKNSKTPGATVLQFSGKRDSKGNLITTADELRYVYDLSDDGTLYKTNKDGTDVIGYNQIAGKAAYALVEKYILPDIEKFKVENRLEG